MDQKELVTVVIPAYNSAHVLPRAIRSVLTQTYEHIELIIVDDGSKDNTEEIVAKIKDSRLRYIKLPTNKGAAGARNEAIKVAKGNYIALLDADDEFLPEKIDENVGVMRENDATVGLVCSNCWFARANREYKTLLHKKGVDTLWHIPSPSTWLVRKEVFRQIGLLDEDLRAGHDREFLFRFHFKYKLKYIDKPLAIRYKLEGKLSSQTDKYIAMRKIFLKKHEVGLRKEKKFMTYQLYRLGKDLYTTGHKKESRQYFLRAFISRPMVIKYLAYYIKSFSF